MTNADVFSPATLAASLYERLGLAPSAPLKVAFSGGLDSHALLYALAGLRAEHGTAMALTALHIDHGIHPDSAEWARHCQQVCAGLGVTFRSQRVQLFAVADNGLEAAARHARYAALKQQLAPGEVLLTAHHLDDQAETVLLQLMRGAGVHGLAGIAPVCDFGAGRLARPLLDVSRATLLAYAQRHGLNWIEDDSNSNLRHRRNVIRHRILPQLQEQWPRAAELLARSACHAGEAAGLLDALAAADLNTCERDHATLSVAALRALSRPRLANALRCWLRRQGLSTPSSMHLTELIASIARDPASGHACLSWPGVELWRYRDDLHAAPPLPRPDTGLDLPWDMTAPLDAPQFGWRLQAVASQGEGLATARLPTKPLHVRLRRGGETCRLPGRQHRHKLKKLLQANHISPWLRPRMPLLYVGDELAAIADLWVCEPYAARAGEPGVRLVLRNL